MTSRSQPSRTLTSMSGTRVPPLLSSFALLLGRLRLLRSSRRRMHRRSFPLMVWMDVLRLGDHMYGIVTMSQLKFLSSKDVRLSLLFEFVNTNYIHSGQRVST